MTVLHKPSLIFSGAVLVVNMLISVINCIKMRHSDKAKARQYVLIEFFLEYFSREYYKREYIAD